MKVTVNVECTPEEARTFFGLPDVAPLQGAVMEQMKSQMAKTAAALDPETMMKMMFPANADGFADMQKAFWGQFMGSESSKPAK